MRRSTWIFGCVALIMLGSTACDSPEPSAPTRPSLQTTEWCDTHPEECNGGIGDPDPAAPGYYLGANIQPSKCFSPTGTGISDLDRDGMDDYCERLIAEQFRPSLNLAPRSFDCDASKEPYWAAKYFPVSGGVVRIAYLFGYHNDCGATGIGSGLWAQVKTLISLNGFINNFSQSFNLEISTSDPGEGHAGDSEWVMVDVRFNFDSRHWYLVRAKYSAHYRTTADGTATLGTSGVEYPTKYAGYPRVWVAKNKHANYPSRDQCNAGRGPFGVAHDNCDPNLYDQERLAVIGLRNIGSLHRNFINAGTCVASTNPSFYPGTECFWVPGDNFFGWARYPWGRPPSPYHSPLVLEFECYSYTGSDVKSCSSFGVVR